MTYKMLTRCRKVSTAVVILTGIGFLFACNGKNIPDVSKVAVKMEVDRFDEAVFSLDTTNPGKALVALKEKHPVFTDDFTAHILGIGPVSDSMSPQAAAAFGYFLATYRPVYDSLLATRKEWGKVEQELKKAFQFTRHYFPEWTAPPVAVYVGPFDAPGVALTENAMAIGLQLFGGRDFFFYQTIQGQEMYPQYISRRFEPAYIPVNAMKAVIDDLFPVNQESSSLLDQMISGGKQWYLQDLLLPETADTLKTGFTANQLEFCRANEGTIYNLILKTTDIYTIDPGMIRLFMGDAPSTQGMSDASPGNIGQFIGWQMVKKYMDKFPETTPKELMALDSKELFSKSGYKPK